MRWLLRHFKKCDPVDDEIREAKANHERASKRAMKELDEFERVLSALARGEKGRADG